MPKDKTINVNYVNSVMSEINDYTDELYESLMDNEKECSLKAIEKLLSTLKDVRSSCRN
tara:strand:- start:472 stop:648 length:177 start_codon:yes stop_codon:yes gene_type:complete